MSGNIWRLWKYVIWLLRCWYSKVSANAPPPKKRKRNKKVCGRCCICPAFMRLISYDDKNTGFLSYSFWCLFHRIGNVSFLCSWMKIHRSSLLKPMRQIWYASFVHLSQRLLGRGLYLLLIIGNNTTTRLKRLSSVTLCGSVCFHLYVDGIF